MHAHAQQEKATPSQSFSQNLHGAFGYSNHHPTMQPPSTFQDYLGGQQRLSLQQASLGAVGQGGMGMPRAEQPVNPQMDPQALLVMNITNEIERLQGILHQQQQQQLQKQHETQQQHMMMQQPKLAAMVSTAGMAGTPSMGELGYQEQFKEIWAKHQQQVASNDLMIQSALKQGAAQQTIQGLLPEPRNPGYAFQQAFAGQQQPALGMPHHHQQALLTQQMGSMQANFNADLAKLQHQQMQTLSTNHIIENMRTPNIFDIGPMIDQSAHKAHLAQQYDITRIFAPPTDEEFENEVQNQVPFKNVNNGSNDFDDDEDEGNLSEDDKPVEQIEVQQVSMQQQPSLSNNEPASPVKFQAVQQPLKQQHSTETLSEEAQNDQRQVQEGASLQASLAQMAPTQSPAAPSAELAKIVATETTPNQTQMAQIYSVPSLTVSANEHGMVTIEKQQAQQQQPQQQLESQQPQEQQPQQQPTNDPMLLATATLQASPVEAIAALQTVTANNSADQHQNQAQVQYQVQNQNLQQLQ